MIINGMECKGDKAKDLMAYDRINNYKFICSKMGIDPEPVTNPTIRC